MAARERIVLIDGTAMVFRAFFAIPSDFVTRTGLHTNAVFGFARAFQKLLGGKTPERACVVFDAPGPTFREERFPAYKAQRPSMPTELVEQLPYIDKLVDAHRFKRLRVSGFEADDVIGTLTRRAEAKDMEVLIVSGDKDFCQLIGPHVRMLDPIREVTYDSELVRKKWGVRPEQFVDLLALMGDDVDNVPGVPGIGQKGAAQLLEKHGSLDGILEKLEVLDGRKKKALTEHRELAILSRALATIETSVPLSIGLDELLYEPPSTEALNVLYRELEFYSLLAESARSEDAREQGPAVQVVVLDAPDRLRAWLDDAQVQTEGRPFALEPLFDLPTPLLGRWVGLAIGAPNGTVAYVPIDGRPDLADELRGFLGSRIEKVAHDAKALMVLAARSDLVIEGITLDTMLASFLIDPTGLIPHRLDQVVKAYLHRTTRAPKGLVGSGQAERPVHDVPMADAAVFAAERVAAVAELAPLLEARLDQEAQLEVLRTCDLPLSRVLAGMELAGIRIDVADLATLGTELRGQLAEIEARVHALAGRTFNIASTKQLGEVLFDELKLPVIRRTKTGYSTDSEVLERLADKHEIAKQLLEQRRVSKLINTYTDVLAASVDPRDGRIHATFQQTVGATGRLITTDPDLQRTPVKTEEGRRIRRAFIADAGSSIVSADWSQIELRVLAHFSKDPRLLEAMRAGHDIHRRTASFLFGVDEAAVEKSQRNIAKTVNFATIYGQGATALSQILGIARRDAERYIAGYFEAYAGVRAWLDRTIEQAHEDGFVTTMLGRRRRIPELKSNNAADRQAGERIAANTPIQGSAADLCKLTMLEIDRALCARGLRARMLLQIHDELVFEVPEGELSEVVDLVRSKMETSVKLDVPLVVELGIGRSWSEAH
ncbi:MAG: DNA polymerase I [Deltaproteobacteria bacterium]|nr:DNA polymerase I [Deltaproteobacteria bacterium]